MKIAILSMNARLYSTRRLLDAARQREVELSRGILMKDAGFDVLWPQFAALTVYTVLVFVLTTWLFRKKVA